MRNKIEKDALESVHHARHQISEQFGYENQMIEHCMNLQQRYKDHFLESEKNRNIKRLPDSKAF